MKPVHLELSSRDAEVIALLLAMAREELINRPGLREAAHISLLDLQNVNKIRKRLTKKQP